MFLRFFHFAGALLMVADPCLRIFPFVTDPRSGSAVGKPCFVLYWYFLNDRHSEQQKSAKGQLGSLMITDIPITSEQLAVLSHFQVRLTA
jgi:hypothetical protein